MGGKMNWEGRIFLSDFAFCGKSSSQRYIATATASDLNSLRTTNLLPFRQAAQGTRRIAAENDESLATAAVRMHHPIGSSSGAYFKGDQYIALTTDADLFPMYMNCHRPTPEIVDASLISGKKCQLCLCTSIALSTKETAHVNDAGLHFW